MKQRVLMALRENNGYVSGQELCGKLGVSRTAIWKIVNSLKEQGYNIESVRNRGYRLIECPDVILPEAIKEQINTKWFAGKIIYHACVDSTNNEVKRLADSEKEGLLVIADEQTAGKGRRGRVWQSPPNSGIWMSFLLKPDIPPDKASMITIVAAMAARRAVAEATGLSPLIKWPNDLVVNGRKITGILTEMATDIESINYVIVGIGFNVNNKSFPEELAATATSLEMELGHEVNREKLIALFGKHFENIYEQLIADGDLSRLKSEYEQYLVNNNAEVVIDNQGKTINARALGINEKGELLIVDKDGNRQAVRAGEVSVRGVYGYV